MLNCFSQKPKYEQGNQHVFALRFCHCSSIAGGFCFNDLLINETGSSVCFSLKIPSYPPLIFQEEIEVI